MANTITTEIRINKRTVRIGHEVYSLANISRMQTVRLGYTKKQSLFKPVKDMIGALFFVVVASVILTASGVDKAQQIKEWIYLLGALYVVYLLILLIYRLFRRPIYVLLIETAGTQFTLLGSYDQGTVRMIENEVVDAIENPPVEEKILHVGDVILGDKIGRQIRQDGFGNVMNVNR